MNLLWYVFASFDTVWAVHGEVFQEGRVFSRGACGTMMCFHLTPEHVHLLAALLFETVMLLPLSLPLQTLFIHLTLMLRFLELPCISLIRNLLPPFLSDIRLILFLIFPVLTKEFLGESLLRHSSRSWALAPEESGHWFTACVLVSNTRETMITMRSERTVPIQAFAP